MRILICGPEESKWKPEQKPKAKSEIEHILLMKGTLIKKEIVPDQVDLSNLIVVSGHCPKGEEKWYCIACDEFVDSFTHSQGHMNQAIKVYDQGGVDTWSEIISTKLGIKKEIYPAICYMEEFKGHTIEGCKEWYQTYPDYKGFREHFWNYHFKPRNIDMAKVCDVCYCIIPKDKTKICRYCWKEASTVLVSEHPTNGCCWTMKYAKELKKETHLIVIE